MLFGPWALFEIPSPILAGSFTVSVADRMPGIEPLLDCCIFHILCSIESNQLPREPESRTGIGVGGGGGGGGVRSDLSLQQ